MKQYSIFHVPFMSFFSRALYRDVCFHWKGVAFGYLLLLLIICWIPQIIKFHTGLTEFVENDVPPMVSQVPTITFADGQASIDEPQPYFIVAPDSNEVLCVIDTTGTITSLDQTDAMFLLTKTEIIYKENDYKTESYEFSDFDDFVLSQDEINKWISVIKTWVTPIFCFFAVIGSYIFRMIQALIYGAIGLLFVNWCKSTHSYASVVRLAVVAVTPVIIVKTILSIAEVHIPFSGILGFLVTMGYLYFAIKVCSREDVQVVDPPAEIYSGISEYDNSMNQESGECLKIVH